MGTWGNGSVWDNGGERDRHERNDLVQYDSAGATFYNAGPIILGNATWAVKITSNTIMAGTTIYNDMTVNVSSTIAASANGLGWGLPTFTKSALKGIAPRDANHVYTVGALTVQRPHAYVRFDRNAMVHGPAPCRPLRHAIRERFQ